MTDTIHDWVRVMYARLTGSKPGTAPTIEAVLAAIYAREVGEALAGRKPVGRTPSIQSLYEWSAKASPSVPSMPWLLALIQWSASEADKNAIVMAWAWAHVAKAGGAP